MTGWSNRPVNRDRRRVELHEDRSSGRMEALGGRRLLAEFALSRACGLVVVGARDGAAEQAGDHDAASEQAKARSIGRDMAPVGSHAEESTLPMNE